MRIPHEPLLPFLSSFLIWMQMGPFVVVVAVAVVVVQCVACFKRP